MSSNYFEQKTRGNTSGFRGSLNRDKNASNRAVVELKRALLVQPFFIFTESELSPGDDIHPCCSKRSKTGPFPSQFASKTQPFDLTSTSNVGTFLFVPKLVPFRHNLQAKHNLFAPLQQKCRNFLMHSKTGPFPSHFPLQNTTCTTEISLALRAHSNNPLKSICTQK